ncbi:MAG: hypothetical protein NT130_04130, partial [Candidatus Micrarchaeota archaeon]|nr:hypothetical protein [Candidatus Micrarchaeota archaeon]
YSEVSTGEQHIIPLTTSKFNMHALKCRIEEEVAACQNSTHRSLPKLPIESGERLKRKRGCWITPLMKS